MAVDGFREPPSMLPIAVRDYLRFGALRSLSLFKAMTSYPTLERVRDLVMPTLVIAGDRDPLVRIDRAHVFAGLPNVQAVKVRGAHALNYSKPELIASLIEAHLAGRPTFDFDRDRAVSRSSTSRLAPTTSRPAGWRQGAASAEVAGRTGSRPVKRARSRRDRPCVG